MVPFLQIENLLDSLEFCLCHQAFHHFHTEQFVTNPGNPGSVTLAAVFLYFSTTRRRVTLFGVLPESRKDRISKNYP